MNLEQQVARKRKLIKKHQKELNELVSTCTHEGYIEHKTSHFSGSYYDKAYTDHWNECNLCGARSETTRDNHSWYG
jgi:DNA-binding winged helix-turn-helix (wHTH) protein